MSCDPERAVQGDYARIARAISFIQSHLKEQPGLDRIASHVGLSPYHFQRKFRQWVGVSPKRFLQCLTVNHAKALMDQSLNILDTSLELGLSGPARLHEQFLSIEAMTPGQYKTRGDGLDMVYGVHLTPFGLMLLAQTDRGICSLSFTDNASLEDDVTALSRQWPRANLVEDVQAIKPMADKIFHVDRLADRKIHLAVRGTNFQVNVWRALLKIPLGRTVSYQQLAHYIGKPEAVRAAANAVATNPIAYLIPCHRVLRKSGALGGYRWGAQRKRLLLALDAAGSQT